MAAPMGPPLMSANTPAKLPCPRWRRADRAALKDPEAVMVELVEYAARPRLCAGVGATGEVTGAGSRERAGGEAGGRRRTGKEKCGND
jgi:hypothetical protein